MSRWAQVRFPTKCRRNRAAVIEPPPMCLSTGTCRRSATCERHGLLVLLDQRHVPRQLAGRVAGGHERVGQVGVAGVQRGVLLAEPERGGARERGDVDEHVGVEGGVRPGQRVGQDQAALGVGVGDLDGGAVPHRQHVTRAVGRATEVVLGERQHGRDPVRDPGGGGTEDRGQRDRGTGHVGLHRDHGLARLDREAARVERDALADDDDVPATGGRRRPGDGHEARRRGGAGADREDARRSPRP